MLMSNKIANRAVMCDVLIEAAKDNKDLLVLTSDSRGSASLVILLRLIQNRL